MMLAASAQVGAEAEPELPPPEHAPSASRAIGTRQRIALIEVIAILARPHPLPRRLRDPEVRMPAAELGERLVRVLVLALRAQLRDALELDLLLGSGRLKARSRRRAFGGIAFRERGDLAQRLRSGRGSLRGRRLLRFHCRLHWRH